MRKPERALPGDPSKQGHPPGLYILFFTEMWERMSYYGMRSLLVFYMTDYLFLMPNAEQRVVGWGAIRGAIESVFGPLAIQPLSSQIYGLYTALVYLTPLIGGVIADRILGQRRTVVIGALIMTAGHFLMAVESLFFPALLCIIIGNGAFKPNVSTQVGLLYDKDDPRRDRAFSTFYVGINLGSLLAALVCGTLGQKLGWHWGFGAAGVGMLLGLAVYLAGRRYLPEAALKPVIRAEKSGEQAATRAPLTREERGRVVALLALSLISVLLYAIFEQQGNTLALWANKNTAWPTVFGWQIPSTWFQALNPALIFILTPLINLFWARQGRRGTEPSSVIKMAIGATIVGLSFLILLAAAWTAGAGAKVSFLWLVLCGVTMTVGELYLTPVGLSMVTKLAPAGMVSLLMGTWYLSIAFGNYFSGLIGTLWERLPKSGFFLLLSTLGLLAGGSIFAMSRWLRRLMGEAPSEPAPGSARLASD